MTNDHRRSLQPTHQHFYGSVHRFERNCILSIILLRERLSKSRTGLQVSVCLCPSGISLLVSGSLSLRLPLQSSSTTSCEYSRPVFTDSHLPKRFQEAASPTEAWDFGDLVIGELRSNWDVLGQLSSAKLLGALYSESQSRPAVLPR